MQSTQSGDTPVTSALPTEPCYMPLNLHFPGLCKVNTSPPIYLCERFLSGDECDALMDVAEPMLEQSCTIRFGSAGKDPGRTSLNCHLAKYWKPAARLLRKVELLTNKPAAHMELPQVT